MKAVKRFLIINVGILIMALGLYFFLFPDNLAVGGVSGLAMVIQTFFPAVNIGVLMLVFNVVLIILAFVLVDRSFGGYTIYASVALSLLIGILEKAMPMTHPFTDDMFLNLIFGILIQGIGMSVIFYEGASTGGTDIIAKIINKYTALNIGLSLFLADSLITLMAVFTFGLKQGLYAFLGILINGLVIDKIIAGFETKVHAIIVTDQGHDIADYIHKELDRGTTFLAGYGGYSKKDKAIISSVVSKREYLVLKKYIGESDEKAFLIVNFVNDVVGNGFSKYK